MSVLSRLPATRAHRTTFASTTSTSRTTTRRSLCTVTVARAATSCRAAPALRGIRTCSRAITTARATETMVVAALLKVYFYQFNVKPQTKAPVDISRKSFFFCNSRLRHTPYDLLMFFFSCMFDDVFRVTCVPRFRVPPSCSCA